jgi:hypothetical protein
VRLVGPTDLAPNRVASDRGLAEDRTSHGRAARQCPRHLSLCRRFPELSATILDFPSVQAAAAAFVSAAGLSERITFAPGNALITDWPAGQDVVLLSYLLSAVSALGLDQLLARAFAALTPGGRGS